ncbi:MAG TPA: type II secretion system ATPase GspE [Nitrospiria bacterium]|nr:type II secretion system ATPase GspE [Nitrospiria bacterium]
MSVGVQKRLGELLREVAGLTEERLNEALTQQRESGAPLGEILIKLRYVTREQFLEALARQFDLPFLPVLPRTSVNGPLLAKIPLSFAKRYGLVPLVEENGQVPVAIADPLNLHLIDDVRLLTGAPVTPVLALSDAIEDVLHAQYEQAQETAEEVIGDLDSTRLNQLAESIEETTDLLTATEDAPIIRLLNSLMFRAVKERASDIHIEPYEREVVVRYRIDGVLHNVLTPPKRVHSALISRVKIMAGLDIAERRTPQDGRIGIRIGDREVDIRVSIIPVANGERAVLRLLDKEHLLLDLDQLGLSSTLRQRFDQLIRLPHGILLVTGPTGSGKTTTLYAALSQINSPDKNILTIEDPIEYQLKGIGQMQINPKINLTFASSLRSILRQDPDVILVGEIRDAETAEISIHAALTGHLVFSTLHTNDAAGAVTRLIDMGIEPFLVASSVVAIMAQRLVRTICSSCKQSYSPAPEELARLGLARSSADGKDRPIMLSRGAGCPVCAESGYRGRVAIYEILLVDDQIRRLIMAKADARAIGDAAVAAGMRTLREDGMAKVLQGVTTAEEVLRMTQQAV